VLRSLIRILRASLAQIDTEKAEKYAKLGKAAKFRSLYDIEGSNPVPASRLWSGLGLKVNQFVQWRRKQFESGVSVDLGPDE